ncbi:vacuolar protein sorting-associated protein 11 homolog isoform X1 [Plutella xylostella]|uniref:vacuolar protein sorting-associated protein 11 homolog isoform X1 n=1 Tax=Plutella xylostella TaxID=51655 RepID=UPI002032C700|nr:vacuolar protein sorting-associated protein 11 homolog isoform X1 [Plutella xylostella]
MLKVWDWSRTARHGGLACVLASRAVPSHMRATPATALAVHQNKNLMAVGFQDGSVSLFRGDITRQRSGKMKTLTDTGSSPITGLFFQGTDKLFIVSAGTVSVYSGDSERCATLDRMGAVRGCGVLCDASLMLASPQAIYCYTTDGRGPCYALEGEKVRLDWFRSYLVITTNETPPKNDNASTSNAPTPKSHHVTILDIQNKFIVFSKTFDEIDAIITEWGSFYILTKSKGLIYLDEKDLQSKLTLLFKKNLYDVAIRIASSQHYDAEGLTEIHKQYGDHLYAKGDLKGAIDQYVKTIGWLETSYVIRKYLESRHLEPLIIYLEELHKKGYATEDHTTLLLTCYVKIDQHDQQGKLKDFINSKDRAIEFDVDVAIKVVRQVSADDAITLAVQHGRHDWALQVMLQDKKQYTEALDYIADLEFDDAEMYMKKYAYTLIQNAPEESTELLKLLCTDYRPRNSPLVDESTLSGGVRERQMARPDDYIPLLLNHSKLLIDLLEHMSEAGVSTPLVYNALLEHYINVWAKSSSESEKSDYESKIMRVLKDPSATYDKDQVLIMCQMLGFKHGILHLYEESKLWRAQLALHLRLSEPTQALAVCKRRGAACPRLWLDLLYTPPPPALLQEVLAAIAQEKLLSPILVIDCLTSTPTYTLGDVRKYLMNVLKSEDEVITREQELASKYRTESEKMKSDIEALRLSPATFQSSRCAACARPLELPTVHFLCQHSYHHHCFQSYSESESECCACAASRPRRDVTARAAETLHDRLQKEHDPYAVVSEYFGRGLFNKIKVTDGAEPEPAPAPLAAPAAPATLTAPAVQTYGPGAEAKLRLQEGQSRQLYINPAPPPAGPAPSATVPVPEGRMRVLEQQQYSGSLEANLSQPEPVHRGASASRKPGNASNSNSSGNSPKISSAITNAKNPFEEENYDESKNPFADEENDPTNPFAEDDDYDKNLNPFS